MEFQFDVDCGITTYARFNAMATRPPGFIPVRAHAMCSLSARSRAVVCSPGPAPSRERGESEHLVSTVSVDIRDRLSPWGGELLGATLQCADGPGESGVGRRACAGPGHVEGSTSAELFGESRA